MEVVEKIVISWHQQDDLLVPTKTDCQRNKDGRGHSEDGRRRSGDGRRHSGDGRRHSGDGRQRSRMAISQRQR